MANINSTYGWKEKHVENHRRKPWSEHNFLGTRGGTEVGAAEYVPPLFL